jgi:hypothetical protein
MLQLASEDMDKKRVQKLLEMGLRSSLVRKGKRNIGFPGGNRDCIVHAAGDDGWYAAFVRPDSNANSPRYWNAFGVFHSGRKALDIVVEINVEVGRNQKRVAGYFARDASSGDMYLMHSGLVGGGRTGVGKSAFLAWSKVGLVEVVDGEGKVRQGVPVARIGGADMTARIWHFVQLVSQFKEQVSRGLLDTPAFKVQLEQFDRYRREFAGRKAGSRPAEFEYLTYHGDVVQALYEERSTRCTDGESVYNSGLLDLYVTKESRITEVYEVKTGADRQVLYTAIGQLATHAAQDGADKYLVLPTAAEIPGDIAGALRDMSIAVRRFAVDMDGKRSMSLSLRPAPHNR